MYSNIPHTGATPYKHMYFSRLRARLAYLVLLLATFIVVSPPQAAQAQEGENVLVKVSSPYGVITSSPAGINCPGDCEESISKDTVIRFTAQPNPGYLFNGIVYQLWFPVSASCIGQTEQQVAVSNYCDYNSGQDNWFFQKTRWSRAEYDVNFITHGTGSGTLSTTYGPTNCNSTCSKKVPYDTTLNIQANPAPGSKFVRWEGGASTPCADLNPNSAKSITPSCSFTARYLPPDGRYDVVAIFEKVPTGSATQTAPTTPAPNTPQSIEQLQKSTAQEKPKPGLNADASPANESSPNNTLRNLLIAVLAIAFIALAFGLWLTLRKTKTYRSFIKKLKNLKLRGL